MFATKRMASTSTTGKTKFSSARAGESILARIGNTLHIETFAASEAALATMRDDGRYAVGEVTDALSLAGDDLAPFHGAAALA